MSLTVKDTMTLDFERRRWKYVGAKETAVRDNFGESMTLYYVRLNRLLEQPEAVAYDPLLVGRLRRLRSARQAARGAKQYGF